jgi:2-dehydro-3-deoxyphosphogalactonate aldolase
MKLTTDNGVNGFGEAYSVPFHPQIVARMIEDVCERYVIGSDPFKIERHWRIIYSSGYTQRPDLSIMGVLSAIEMSCWDVIGKELNKPIYALLGGQVHEKLRAYSYLYPQETDTSDVYTDPELAAERAAEYVKKGFTAVKFDPVGPYSAFDPRQLSLEALEHAEKYVKLLRDAVGGKCDLLFGTQSILQMALGRVGGILEAKKITGMAEAHYAQIAPHLYCGPIEGAANIQIDTCSPNFLIQEGIETWGGFHSK